MIDTIFYFCPTQEEYDRTADTTNGGEGISDKTITFVEDVREIYLNGKGYGKTSTAGLVSDDRLTSTITALQESLSNTILQTNTNLDAVEADLLQQLATTETGIQNTIATLRSDTEGAISRLKVEVLDDVDEGFVAKANLDTYVTNAVKDGLGISSLADVALKSDITSSEATISTRFLTVEGDVSTLQGGLTTTNSSLATLQAQSNADHAKIAAVADWSGWVEGLPVSFNGGLITQANADGVIAGLIANSSSDVAAAVSAQVVRGTSNITLTADKIYLDASTTLANTIQATQGNIAGFTISNNSLSASLGDYSIELTPYHFATFKNSTLTNEIKSDGSGSIASGGITWNNNGTITLSLEFLRSLFNALHNGAVNLDVYGGINETFPIYEDMPNVPGYYIDNIQQLLNEDYLWSTSYLQGIFNDGTGDNVSEHCINAAAANINLYTNNNPFSNGYRNGQTYPINGTVQEKRDWFFVNHDTIGTFLSGILVSKKLVDHESQLEKDQLSELYIDNHIYIIHIPTLNEFATANSLDITKFKGIIAGSGYSYDPYHIDLSNVTLYFTSRSAYSGDSHDFWNVYYDADGYNYRYNNLTRINMTFRTNAYVEEHGLQDLLANPTEGTWLFVGNHRACVDGDVSNTRAYYNAYTLNREIHRYTPLLSLVILKYTNGAWTVLENPTFLQKTVTQYRSNES